MKKNKRQRTKYPALKPELNLRTRYELIDYDYISLLSEEDKKWLNDFTEEYVNASLDSKNLENNLHNTDELKKDCYSRNNARNRDILTRAKASGGYVSLDEIEHPKGSARRAQDKGEDNEATYNVLLDEHELLEQFYDLLSDIYNDVDYLKNTNSYTDENGN
jgi:hypothetical protein